MNRVFRKAWNAKSQPAKTRAQLFFRKAWNAKSQPARTRAHRRGGATFFARHGMRNPSPRGRGRTDAGAQLFSQGMECEIPAREDAGAPTRGRNFFRKAWNAKSQPARTRARRRGGAIFLGPHLLQEAS